MEEIEKATFDHLVELQLRREGYVHHAPPELEVVVDDAPQQQQTLSKGQRIKYESIPMIDQMETSTMHASTAAPEAPEEATMEEKVALDREIERLQKDLKDITAKIEDYNFSQCKLEQELGYAKKKNVGEGEKKKWWKSLKKSATTLEGAKSPSLPLLGPSLSLAPGGNDEADTSVNYMRQTTTATENAYTRQSTVLTNDTLLTESVVEGASANKTKMADEKFLKIDL